MIQTRAKRLKDFERWKAAGWLTPAGASSIRSEIEATPSGITFAHMLATMAAVLIGFAAMSFVAANWQDMSKLARIAIIFSGIWTFLGLAAWLRLRAQSSFADAASLAAVAVYGAGIMLIAQMYHMSGRPQDAVLLWGIGAVAAGLMMRSNTVLVAALTIFCFWTLMETMRYASEEVRPMHWPFLLAWASVAIGFTWNRWRAGLRLLLIALSGWIILQPYQHGIVTDVLGHGVVMVIGIVIIGLSIAIANLLERWHQPSQVILPYGCAVTFAGMLAVQFVASHVQDRTLLYGVLALLAILAVLAWAWRTENRGALWITYAAFSIEIFALYVKTIGTLLGTSLFFLIMGLVVAALAAIALFLHGKRPTSKVEP